MARSHLRLCEYASMRSGDLASPSDSSAYIHCPICRGAHGCEAQMPQPTTTMWFQISITALLLQAGPTPQPRLAGSARASELSVTDQGGYAVLGFLSTWRTAWLESAG